MGYSWRPEEAMGLLGIRLNTKQQNQAIRCPACSGKRFLISTSMGMGKCWECEFRADTASYYATEKGMTVAEARRDIEQQLGIDKDSWKKGSLERQVYNTAPKVPQSDRASDKVLDDTYRAFLAELKLSDKNKYEMIARCGCDDDQLAAWNYKTFPSMEEIDYFSLCKRLQQGGHILKGVPGFFRAKQGAGDFMFFQITKGIIMPLVNHQNQIVGLQVRKDDDKRVFRDDLEGYEPKCSWLSSKNLASGCGAVAGVHYACDWKYDIEDGIYKPVFEDGFVLTEGIMKADIIHYLMPNLPVIAVPGVNCTNQLAAEIERLKSWGVKTIRLAYDMDYKTNAHVQKALEKTQQIIKDAGMHLINTEWETQVEGHDEISLKGFDDYVAYAKLGIVPKVKALTPDKIKEE